MAAWVTQPERPNGAKEKVKRLEGPSTRRPLLVKVIFQFMTLEWCCDEKCLHKVTQNKLAKLRRHAMQ